MASFKQAAVKILRSSDKPLHYTDITRKAIDNFLITTFGSTPARTMNSIITQDIKIRKNESFFESTKFGYFQLNPNYTINRQKSNEKIEQVEERIRINETKKTQYIGKAGEHYVISELLFRGWNANTMTVDEGIDIIATKNDRTYYIQVKTANENHGKYIISININSYKKYNSSDVMFIFVLRNKNKKINFIILSYVEIMNLMRLQNTLSSKTHKYRSIIITQIHDDFFSGSNIDNINYNVNHWDHFTSNNIS